MKKLKASVQSSQREYVISSVGGKTQLIQNLGNKIVGKFLCSLEHKGDYEGSKRQAEARLSQLRKTEPTVQMCHEVSAQSLFGNEITTHTWYFYRSSQPIYGQTSYGSENRGREFRKFKH